MNTAAVLLAARLVSAPVPVVTGTPAPLAASAPAIQTLTPAVLSLSVAAPIALPLPAAPITAIAAVASPAEPRASLTALSASKLEAGPLWDASKINPAASTPEPVPAPAAAKPPRAGLAKALRAAAPVAAVTVAAAVLDIGVVEGYLHPLHRAGIPWDTFETSVLGVNVLKWWLYFVPVTAALVAGAGWMAAKWRGALAGFLLFATGWEDILYYWLRGSSLPDGLGWLDINPMISWTRLLTRSESITSTGLLISAALGAAAALTLLARRRA